MEEKIITPQEVISLAFTDGEYLAAEVIAAADISAAVERWILPVVGESLIKAVAAGAYEEFAAGYLKPTLAAYVRLEVQPRLNVATSQMGLTIPSTTHRKVADESMRRELMVALKRRAESLRRRMSRYLDAEAAEMPEYDPTKNVLKRSSCYGGFVQIH